MESLPNPRPTPETKGTDLFTIFRFKFPGADGEKHTVESLGYFLCPIEAFDAARDCAQAEFSSVRDAGAHVQELVLLATEFGYELRDGARTVVRFWIKCRMPHTVAG